MVLKTGITNEVSHARNCSRFALSISTSNICTQLCVLGKRAPNLQGLPSPQVSTDLAAQMWREAPTPCWAGQAAWQLARPLRALVRGCSAAAGPSLARRQRPPKTALAGR
jgi:hypothetical protein